MRKACLFKQLKGVIMAKDLLTSWLNDAYEMEQMQIRMLERAAQDFEEYGDISDKLGEHLEQTRRQANDVRHCLELLGEETSGVKRVMGDVKGFLQSMRASIDTDDMVKTMITLHASEHYEHATYIAIMTAAQNMDQEEIAQTCARIASEEQDMADWVEERLPEVVADAVLQETIEDVDEEDGEM